MDAYVDLRKRVSLWMTIPFLLLGATLQVTYAQQTYSTVYELYYELYRSPETGDSTIQANQQLFDNQFINCVNRLMSSYQALALDHYGWCDQVYADPRLKAQCRNENEPAKMHHWLRTIEQVTRGERIWSDTLMGQAQIMVKQLIAPTQYNQIVASVVPPKRPYMLCEMD